MWRAALCVLALSACSPGADVVARAVLDAGTDASPVPKKEPPANDPACGSSETTLAVLTKAGQVHSFDASLKEIVAVPPGCGGAGPSALAVDRAGTLWTAVGGKVLAGDPKNGTCKTLPLELHPSVMAFVWDPKLGSEALYAVVEGALVVIDMSTFESKTIGKLTPALDELRGLTGTVDGWLLAFAGDLLVTIAYVDPTSAVVKPTSQLKSADPVSRFAGGVPTRSGFELVFGQRAWAFDPTTGGVTLHATLFEADPGVIAVAASPCSTLGK
jgi:hypothetical protein